MADLRITFLLPGAGALPSGGLKIVYEYANRLASRGHHLAIVHPAMLRKDTRWIERPKKAASYIIRRSLGSFRPSRWFKVDPAVRMLWAPTLDEKYVPDADVVIATAWETAEWARAYRGSKGRGFYFIQDFEDWSCPKERLLQTWKAPLCKIVIAKWLGDIARDIGEDACYVPNGLDFDRFGIDQPPDARDPNCVGMLYHPRNTKGVADGLAALNIVQQAHPDLHLTLFGTCAPPRNLPNWATYHHNPSQQRLRELYNHAATFVAPSWTEGWGLTACEAIMCGAALAATDNGGHREFAIPRETALFSPPKSPADLAQNIAALVSETPLRLSLAANAASYIRRFQWSTSIDKFERCLLQG